MACRRRLLSPIRVEADSFATFSVATPSVDGATFPIGDGSRLLQSAAGTASMLVARACLQSLQTAWVAWVRGAIFFRLQHRTAF